MTYKYTKEQIKDTVEGLGYKYFEGDNYDVNIIGIRNSKTEGRITNKFDDLMTISYKDADGVWHYNEYNCTTDPGTVVVPVTPSALLTCTSKSPAATTTAVAPSALTIEPVNLPAASTVKADGLI
jgi:hypothetical protein